MSKHKSKKRRSNSSAAVRSSAQMDALADQKDRARKRMDPTARLLLLGDMVFLAICQLLDNQGVLSPFLSGVTTILGVVILLLALYFQFIRRENTGGPHLK